MISARLLRYASFVKIGVCLLVVVPLFSPLAAAQVNGDAAEIASFLGGLTFVEGISPEMLAEFDSRFETDPEEARQYLGNWGEMTRAEKAERLRAIMGPPPVIEWLPGLGTVTIDGGELHRSQFDRANWVVDQVGEQLFLRTNPTISDGKTGGASEITFFDGANIVLTSRLEGPDGQVETFTSAFARVDGSDHEGRDRDAAVLAGEWTLVALDDHHLDHFPPIRFLFRPDGSFEVNADRTHRGLANVAEDFHEGLWGITISHVIADAFETGDESEGRLLVLASPSDDPDDRFQLFVIERLDLSSLNLWSEGEAGVVRLHLRR